ncbi:hypothetical protein ACTJLD_22225 [Burkholderia sp. 22088]|uniref:hypothetical protein n=1 Tax=Burkholderia sp. 22088 TaxID=3453871 RepID=UPI003F83DFDC
MEALVGTAAGFGQPCTRRGLRIEARRVSLDFEELDKVLAVLNAERAGGPIPFPQSIVKVDVLPQCRIGF